MADALALAAADALHDGNTTDFETMAHRLVGLGDHLRSGGTLAG